MSVAKTSKKFDLKERIIKFVMSVVNLTRRLPKDNVNLVLINQVISYEFRSHSYVILRRSRRISQLV